MKARIGYLIPEFPGQTHIFLWRERQVLASLGIETDIVSTKRPPRAIASHVWAAEAEKNTSYLVPFTIKDYVGALLQILKAGPAAWIQCLAVIMKAKDTSFLQKIRLVTMILVAGKLIQLARTKGWSHVHVHSCADAANVAMFAAILSDITYSLTLHGPTLEVYGANQQQKWKYSCFALVVSEQLLNDVKEKLANFLPKNIVVAPMGVDLDVIKRQSPYTPWLQGNPCRIFSCGRLNPVKGHKYLIDSVEILRQWGFDVRLQIAGEDELGGSGYRLELEKIIQDKSLSEYVELLGAVSEERIRAALENAHVFALASFKEGIPVAVMEAMAMEVPVVVTNSGGGVRELVDEGINGLLVELENPNQLASAIAQVLKDSDLSLRLGKAAREKVSKYFHSKRSAEVLVSCLSQIAEKGVI